MKKDFDFDRIGKQNPFLTPEGFFERMQAESIKRVTEERSRKKRYFLQRSVTVGLAMAAMICGFLLLPQLSQEEEKQPTTTVWLAQTTEVTDVIDLYLQNLTDEELEEWIEFSENDIFYELTNENLNENED
ncbi:MAG: hypothetical protein E7099_05970 [Mediterranea massiliensis]|nr:hypothetical protein [Mediterranea massiliensis]